MSKQEFKLLHIDLTNGSFKDIIVPPSIFNSLLGGKGLGAKILLDQLPPGCDPLGSENLLLFMAGPLTGTLAPAVRACVITKSPLTGTFADSYFGGHLGPEIRYLGYLGIIISGRAAEPSYILLENGNFELRSASHLWGQDTFATTQSLKEEMQDSTVKVGCIGPAGEKMIPFALINCEYNRHAGRGGTGAVMGSKNLKALVLKGSETVTVAREKDFMEAVQTAFSELENNEDVAGFSQDGTAAAVDFANSEFLLPTYNYYQGGFSQADGLNADAQRKHLWLRDTACTGCPVACNKVGKIRTGSHRGLVADTVEYETAAMMGSNLGIGHTRELIYLLYRCDALGLDGMSAGGVLGFAMEAAARNIISTEDSEGVALEFGSVKAADYLLDIIASGRTELGRILGQGVKKAAESLGGEAEEFAAHTKGLESPAWGPRSLPGMALALATSDRGGCHQRAFPVLFEVGGEWKGEGVSRLGLEDKAEIVFYHQNHLAGLDTLVKCDFGQYGITRSTYSRLLNAVLDWEISPDDFLTLGERVWNLVRLFNIREGFSRKDDSLPRRFTREPLPDGPYKGEVIKQEDLDQLLDDYYHLRGWDEKGQPTAEHLERLGLKNMESISWLAEDPKILTGGSENEKPL